MNINVDYARICHVMVHALSNANTHRILTSKLTAALTDMLAEQLKQSSTVRGSVMKSGIRPALGAITHGYLLKVSVNDTGRGLLPDQIIFCERQPHQILQSFRLPLLQIYAS
jgi:hypothetical protein